MEACRLQNDRRLAPTVASLAFGPIKSKWERQVPGTCQGKERQVPGTCQWAPVSGHLSVVPGTCQW